MSHFETQPTLADIEPLFSVQPNEAGITPLRPHYVRVESVGERVEAHDKTQVQLIGFGALEQTVVAPSVQTVAWAHGYGAMH